MRNGKLCQILCLCASKVVDVIEVKWPTTQKVERFAGVEANQIITIEEGAGIIKTQKIRA